MEQALENHQIKIEKIKLNENTLKRFLVILKWIDRVIKNILISIFIPSEADRKLAEQKEYVRTLTLKPNL